jgi:predicted transcriptional regulator YheO
MLKHLAHLIRNGAQLTLPRGRGKPKQATKGARDRILWLLYENGIFDSKRSDDAFREIAAKFGVSEQTVRQAVTKLRKPPSKILTIETL